MREPDTRGRMTGVGKEEAGEEAGKKGTALILTGQLQLATEKLFHICGASTNVHERRRIR
jgi:hypothetical protein